MDQAYVLRLTQRLSKLALGVRGIRLALSRLKTAGDLAQGVGELRDSERRPEVQLGLKIVLQILECAELAYFGLRIQPDAYADHDFFQLRVGCHFPKS